MGSISGGGQNAMSLSPASNISNVLSHQIRTGQVTPQALVAAKIRMAQRNMLGEPQSSLRGISGARQTHPSSGLSMLGYSINRATPPMQRSPMRPTGPPKLMTGMNLHESTTPTAAATAIATATTADSTTTISVATDATTSGFSITITSGSFTTTAPAAATTS